MSQVTITLPDGSSRAVSAGTPVRDVAAEISPNLAKAAFAAVVEIARACRRFRGDLGILWHNDEILRTARQKRWYAELIAAVTAPTRA